MTAGALARNGMMALPFDSWGRKAVGIVMVCTSAICLFVFWEFIFGDRYLLFADIGDDSVNSFLPFYTLATELWQKGNPEWSWKVGMGQDVAHYEMGNPFVWIYILAGKSSIPSMIVWVECLKIHLTAVFIFFFLYDQGLRVFTCVSGSIVFAFSGYMLTGITGWYPMSGEVMLIAFSLFCAERYHQRGDWKWIFIMAFALSWSGFFLLVYISMPVMFWLFLRSREDGSGHGAGRAGLVKGYLSGVLTGGIWLLYSIRTFMESSRTGDTFDGTADIKPLGLIRGEELRTAILRLFSNSAQGNGVDFKGWWNYMEAPAFWFATGMLLFSIPFLFSLKGRSRWGWGIPGFILLFVFLFPWWRSLFWGGKLEYYRTFGFFITIYLFVAAARGMDAFLNGLWQKWRLLLVCLAWISIVLLLRMFSGPSLNSPVMDQVLIFLLMYTAVLLIMRWFPRYSPAVGVLFGLILFTEVAAVSHYEVNERGYVTQEHIDSGLLYNDETVDLVRQVKQRDPGFYRMVKNYSSGFSQHHSLNDGLIQDFNPVVGYSSYFRKNFITFTALTYGQSVGVIDRKWVWGIMQMPLIGSFASVKYFLSKGVNQLSPSLYPVVASAGAVSVQESRLWMPLATAFDKVIPSSQYQRLSELNRAWVLYNAIVVDDNEMGSFSGLDTFSMKDTLTEFRPSAFLAARQERDIVEKLQVSDTEIRFRVRTPQPKIILLSFPFDQGWSETSGIPLFRADGGLTALRVSSGMTNISLRFQSAHRFAYRAVTCAGLVFTCLLFLSDLRRRRKAIARGRNEGDHHG